VLHAIRWKCRTQKIAKNSPSGHHRTILSDYIFATKAHIDNKKRVKHRCLPTCQAVWGIPANFNGFRVLASFSDVAQPNQTLHDVCLSPGLVHYIFTFGGSCLVTEFYQVQSSLCVQVLRSLILAALLHGARVVGVSQVGVSQTLRR